MSAAGNLGPLTKLILGLTYACQSRCVHCSCALHPVARRRELALPEIHGLLRDAARIGVQGANLFGGEPLLELPDDRVGRRLRLTVSLDPSGRHVAPRVLLDVAVRAKAQDRAQPAPLGEQAGRVLARGVEAGKRPARSDLVAVRVADALHLLLDPLLLVLDFL